MSSHSHLLHGQGLEGEGITELFECHVTVAILIKHPTLSVGWLGWVGEWAGEQSIANPIQG